MDGVELANRYVETGNRGDTAGWAALFAEDAAIYDPFYPEPVRGRDAIEQMEASLRASFPTMQWRLLGPALDAGDRVSCELAVQGTQDGPLAMPDGSELPASGNEVSFQTGVFWNVNKDGLITEERSYFDVTGVASQLGLLG
jgi:steroid delta-isomerase-like uncharacterized protein